MLLIRVVPERYRVLLRELMAFGFAGAINTGLGFLIFNWLLGLGSLTANAISTACATASSFILNRHVTYRHRPRTALRRELPLFIFFNLIGLGLQQAIMAGGKWSFGLAETDRLALNLVRVAAVAVGTVFLLLTYRTFVFKKAPETAVDLAPGVVAAELSGMARSGHGIDAAVGSANFQQLTEPLEAEYALGELLDGGQSGRTTVEIDPSALRPARTR